MSNVELYITGCLGKLRLHIPLETSFCGSLREPFPRFAQHPQSVRIIKSG